MKTVLRKFVDLKQASVLRTAILVVAFIIFSALTLYVLINSPA